MNIFNKKFEKKIKKKQNEFTLKINFNLDFSDELSYKIFGKNHLIQCGILKKNNSPTKIKIYFTSIDSIFILAKIDNCSEYFEIVSKNDLLKLLNNNKNIEINIKKKPSFDNLSTNLLTDYINNLKVNCSESDSDDTNNINFYSDSDDENDSTENDSDSDKNDSDSDKNDSDKNDSDENENENENKIDNNDNKSDNENNIIFNMSKSLLDISLNKITLKIPNSSFDK